MAGRLRLLLDEIEGRLTTAYAVSPAPLTFGFGTKDINEHDSAPRVVWVPVAASHTAAEKQTTNGKSVLTRNPTVVAHCWGASFDELEELVHQVILAVHGSARADASHLGEEWPPEMVTHHGCVALVKFSVKVPVLKAPLQVVQPRALEKDTTGSAPGDGNIDWGES